MFIKGQWFLPSQHYLRRHFNLVLYQIWSILVIIGVCIANKLNQLRSHFPIYCVVYTDIPKRWSVVFIASVEDRRIDEYLFKWNMKPNLFTGHKQDCEVTFYTFRNGPCVINVWHIKHIKMKSIQTMKRDQVFGKVLFVN